ncbi:outer membrane beta-barrel protein [Microbulbifer hainanensis]|uniref:outer membrane beta-barrel protein n=1 Tax=Microbulbifer hainanensis TaxID=2735675 RepID=UPI001866B1D1|nr:outer membrane beta-barrel protein [Microbulbifer hainanensis]
MRNIVKGIAALALVGSSAAYAEGAYWGGTVGLMDIDLNHADSPLNVGLRGGYTLPSGWGFEAEYTNSLISGDADVFSRDVDIDVETLGAYGTYRSYGDIYFKGRLGVVHEDVDYFGSDTGISLGGGVGLNVSPNTNVELEYTMIDEDIGFWSGTMTLNF